MFGGWNDSSITVLLSYGSGAVLDNGRYFDSITQTGYFTMTRTTTKTIDLNSIRSLTAANYLGSIGALTIVILPGIVGVIADTLQLDPGQVGLVMSADIITMAASMGVTAFLIHKLNWRVLAVTGLVLLLAGSLLSIRADTYQAMVFARLVAGIGEGMSVSVAFAIFGGTRNPDRQFGIYLVVILSMAATLLYFIPGLLASGGKAYVFAMISLLVALNFLFVPWLPISHGEEHSSSDDASAPLPYLLVGLGLATVFLYFMAQGEAWAFMERIAANAGLSGQTIGNSLALSNVGGVAGALIAASVSIRFGRAWPIIISAVISIAGLVLLLGDINGLSFATATLLYLFGWNLTQPYFSGIMAELDPKGRVVVMMGAVQTAGLGLGPGVVGSMIRGDDFSIVSILGIVLILLSLITVLSLLYLQKL